MPLVSVLTPVHVASVRYLGETLRSVRGQVLPPGWELEWVVQEDGPGSGVVDRLADFDGVRYAASGDRFSAAITRNLALARASGELLQNLDADDLLLPDALLSLITLFENQPDLHWAVGQADDLLPDGTRRSFPPDLPFGRVRAGVVNAWAAAYGGNWPIHCAGVMYRTASVRALGGWAATPSDEDIALFAALSEVTDGWFDAALTWLYRQHPDQSIRVEKNRRWSEVGRRIALQRVRATRFAGLQLTATNVDIDPHVEVAPAGKNFGRIEG
jgi:glycosyltransferase involved in cell wall biosynthesis